MGGIGEELQEMLNVETAFTLHLGGIDIPIAESTAVSWIVMLVILLLCLILGSNLKLHNISKRQAIAELIVTKLQSIVSGMMEGEGTEYIPYLITVLLFIGLSNIVGLIGMKPPTKDLNITVALAVMTIVLVQVASIRKKGVKGWLKSFSEPIAVVTPINILELVIKPLSLCMRLFGNVIGAFVIMELIKIVIPIIVPAALSLYFDIFDGLLQAYIFTFLSAMYIKEAIE